MFLRYSASCKAQGLCFLSLILPNYDFFFLHGLFTILYMVKLCSNLKRHQRAAITSDHTRFRVFRGFDLSLLPQPVNQPPPRSENNSGRWRQKWAVLPCIPLSKVRFFFNKSLYIIYWPAESLPTDYYGKSRFVTYMRRALENERTWPLARCRILCLPKWVKNKKHFELSLK